MTERTSPRRRPRAWLAPLRAGAITTMVATTVAILAACGGGGGVGAGGTGTGVLPLAFASGPVDGLGGELVVAGARFGIVNAAVSDDDGNLLPASSLHLGARVEIDAMEPPAAAASATRIVVRVELVGPVSAAWDPASGRLAVMGQPVRTNAGTVLEGFAGGAPGIAPDAVVAVSALYDAASGTYVATRIDPAAPGATWSVRGAVTAVDAAAHRFTLGAQVIDDGAAALPAGFAAGQRVRVRLESALAPSGHWVARSVAAAAVVPAKAVDVFLRGAVDASVDGAGVSRRYDVGGLAVTVPAAAVGGLTASPAPQARVRVVGKMTAGGVQATSLTVLAATDDDADHGLPPLELDGPVAALDTTQRTFGLGGSTTVDYGGALVTGGGASDLANGVQVVVLGTLSADGTRLVATSIAIGPG